MEFCTAGDVSLPEQPEESKQILEFKRLSPMATVPRKGTEHSAGYDLFGLTGTVLSHGKNMIGTGIACKMPANTVGFIKPRSGLAARYAIDVLGGVIDSDYRGEIKVLLFSPNDEPVLIPKEQAIAQLVFLPCINNFNVFEVSELDQTDRGIGGFGSTDR